MNRIWIAMLETGVKALAGSLNYEQIKNLAATLMDSPLSGNEKRDLLLHEARSIGVAVGKALLNLAIEAAVVALKARR